MNIRDIKLPLYYLIFTLLFILSSTVRTRYVEWEVFFDGTNLYGFEEKKAKTFVLDRLKEIQEEEITIKERGLVYIFKKGEVCQIEPFKIIREVLQEYKEPLLNCSSQEFSSLLIPHGFSREAINFSYGKLLEGYTFIDVPVEILTPLRENAFLLPLKGAVLPLEREYLPNAPRTYRAGVHHGIDFYNGYVGILINNQTSVYASYKGEIIRIDHGYRDISYSEWKKLSQESIRKGFTLPSVLDKFMGRQIHIKHNGDVTTKYAHLSWVRPDLKVGDIVEAGEFIALVGSSGTGGGKPHLHFEVWEGDRYLGADLTPKQARELYDFYFKEW